MLYLYAVASGLERVDDLVGAAQEPLDVLKLDSLLVVFGVITQALPIDEPTLTAQDRLVRALHARAAALLPMRFGAVFADESEVARAIETHAVGLSGRLNDVRGREQMTLRISGSPTRPEAASAESRRSSPSQPPRAEADASSASDLSAIARPSHSRAEADASGLPGTEFLRSRARPPEIAPLLDALAPLVRATRVERGRVAGVVATVYHLIERGTDARYRKAVEDARPLVRELSVHVTGPAPCYAFASDI